MKTKTNFSFNGDEARFTAAIADFEAQESDNLMQERRAAIPSLAPSLEVFHLDTDRFLVLIDPASQDEWQFPQEECEVAACSISLPLNAYALFVRSRASLEQVQENVSFMFLPF